MGKRVASSILGCPIWLLIGLSIFIIFSVGYDLAVGDTNMIRYSILGAAVIILIISILLNMISLRSLSRVAKRQMGG